MIKKNSIAYMVLLGLEKSIQAGVLLNDFANNTHLHAFSGYPREINYGGLYQAVKDLREKGLVETLKDENRIMIMLTDKGRQEIITRRLLSEEKWDGKWRVVIFDIPENKRKLRNALRWKLKEWEFVPWQKSVWAGKKNVTKLLRAFIEEVGLADWVKVLVCNELD